WDVRAGGRGNANGNQRLLRQVLPEEPTADPLFFARIGMRANFHGTTASLLGRRETAGDRGRWPGQWSVSVRADQECSRMIFMRWPLSEPSIPMAFFSSPSGMTWLTSGSSRTAPRCTRAIEFG